MSTYAEIQQMKDEKISQEVVSSKKEQMNLRFQKATGTLENPNRIRELKKQVARLKTEQSARKNADSK